MLDEFLRSDGLLRAVLRAVREDPDRRLDLAIRDHYVNLYYLGTNLMEIRQPNPAVRRLETFWDERYLPSHADNPWVKSAREDELGVEEWLEEHGVLGRQPLTGENVQRHIDSIPYRMKAMASCKERHPKLELKTQQAIARSCCISANSEYLICDTEYSFQHDRHESSGQYRSDRKVSRIDLIAAHRSQPGVHDAPARLALIELKYGVGAIDGPAGLRSHVRDVGRLLTEAGNLNRIANDMVRVMRQKLALGVVPTAIPAFDLTPPVDYIIAVAHHKSKSQILRDALLGRDGLGDGPLVVPEGLAVKVVVLDEGEPTLRMDRMISLDDILTSPMPKVIFDGRLRQRRRRKDEQKL